MQFILNNMLDEYEIPDEDRKESADIIMNTFYESMKNKIRRSVRVKKLNDILRNGLEDEQKFCKNQIEIKEEYESRITEAENALKDEEELKKTIKELGYKYNSSEKSISEYLKDNEDLADIWICMRKNRRILNKLNKDYKEHMKEIAEMVSTDEKEIVTVKSDVFTGDIPTMDSVRSWSVSYDRVNYLDVVDTTASELRGLENQGWIVNSYVCNKDDAHSYRDDSGCGCWGPCECNFNPDIKTDIKSHTYYMFVLKPTEKKEEDDIPIPISEMMDAILV